MMPIDMKELKERKQLYKEFLILELKGFKKAEKMAKEIWKEKNERTDFNQSNVKIQKNNKPKNYAPFGCRHNSYAEMNAV